MTDDSFAFTLRKADYYDIMKSKIRTMFEERNDSGNKL